jgi:serine/threonine protein kinase
MRDRVTSSPEGGGASPPEGFVAPGDPGCEPLVAVNAARGAIDACPPEPALALPVLGEATGEPFGQSRASKPTLKEGPGEGAAPQPLAADPGAERLVDEIWKGELIAGKYRVEEVIGKGGMGVVLRARHQALDEPVAIKVLRPAMMDVPGMVTRFTREARAASKIKSPHVARVTDVDVLPSGVPYMVLEYLEGVDLLSALRHRTGPFPLDEAVGHVIDACDAIAEAHELGIVHRDLKPGNLFLARLRSGKTVVKVLDFGISKVGSAADSDTTRTGQLMGSPKYMSPEQMASMRDVDGRSDIWALGAILYELATGRPPFVAETMPLVCALVLNSDPSPPRALRPDLPLELEAVILRCLEKDPSKRFATIAELVHALTPFGPQSGAHSESTLPPRPRPAPTSTPRPHEHTPTATPAGTVSDWDSSVLAPQVPQRRSPLPIVIGALALALALGAAFLVLGRDDAPASAALSPSALPIAAQPLATATTPLPTPSSDPGAAPGPSATSAPAIPVSALPSVPGDPRRGPLPAKKIKPETDPFGGSRK